MVQKSELSFLLNSIKILTAHEGNNGKLSNCPRGEIKYWPTIHRGSYDQDK